MAKVFTQEPSENSPDWIFYCIGCRCHHGVWTTKPIIVDGKPHIWSFNGDVDKPTFTPSIHIKRQRSGSNINETICHSFVKNGMIEYLSDCKHEFKGQTVEIPDV